jgi:hypothetical protein
MVSNGSPRDWHSPHFAYEPKTLSRIVDERTEELRGEIAERKHAENAAAMANRAKSNFWQT